MGNQLCSYCIALQDENFTSASRLREIKQFAEMEKRRQEEEETKKQLLRALIYEDILRRVNKENEIEAARKAAIDARKNKIEAENLNAINKAEAEIYRIQAEQNAVRAMLASMEEQKDERQKPAPPAPAPAPIVVVKAEKVEVKAEKVEVKTDPKVLTSLIIAPAQSDVETEQDIEKETTTVEENETVAFLMDITFNQSSQQSAGIKILPYKLAYLTVTDDYPIIDCCIVTSSTLTSFCQPGDIVVKINKKVCIACPLVTSGITTGGISGMVKSVEKSLNRSKGARKVRFLRLPNVLAASPGSASVTSVLTKNSPVNTRVLTPAEAALLLEEQDSNEIRQLDVENNRGSVSFRNSISFRNSLTLSLSLALSPNRTLATTAPTNSV